MREVAAVAIPVTACRPARSNAGLVIYQASSRTPSSLPSAGTAVFCPAVCSRAYLTLARLFSFPPRQQEGTTTRLSTRRFPLYRAPLLAVFRSRLSFSDAAPLARVILVVLVAAVVVLLPVAPLLARFTVQGSRAPPPTQWTHSRRRMRRRRATGFFHTQTSADDSRRAARPSRPSDAHERAGSRCAPLNETSGTRPLCSAV